MKIQYRKAELSDAQAMLDIYAQSVSHSHVSFETEVPSLKEYEARFLKISEKFPWWVALHDKQVVGFTYAGLFRERAAYAWALESSIYLHPRYKGLKDTSDEALEQSVAQCLYEILFRELSKKEIKQVIGVIALPNEASVRFHEKCGFQEVGTFRSIGFKMGRWWDVVFMTKFLTEQSSDE